MLREGERGKGGVMGRGRERKEKKREREKEGKEEEKEKKEEKVGSRGTIIPVVLGGWC